MKLIDHILYSKTTKIAILLVTCLAIGFIAPAMQTFYNGFTQGSQDICHFWYGCGRSLEIVNCAFEKE